MALKDRVGRYATDTERGIAFDLSNDPSNNGYQVGTYANKWGGVGGYLDRGNTNLLQGGINVADDNTYNVGGSMAFPVGRSFYNEINTPLGMLAYGANTPQYSNNPMGNVYGDFTPNNQSYIQALLNLLHR